MSSYADQNLSSGEFVQYRTRLHWSIFIWPSVFAFLLAWPGLALLLSDSKNLGPLGGSLILLALCPLGIVYFKRACAEFAVTNKRVILKWGIIRRNTTEMFLSKVESIGVTQNPLGRVLNYGTVVVRGTGGTPEPFVKVDHPLEFRRQVQDQVDRAAAQLTSVAVSGK